MFKTKKKMSAGSSRAQAIMWIMISSFILIIIISCLWLYFWQGINIKNIQGTKTLFFHQALSDQEIDNLGRKLADWSMCSTITINDLPVNGEGPNAGGCSRVYYDRYLDERDLTSLEEQLAYFDQNSDFKDDPRFREALIATYEHRLRIATKYKEDLENYRENLRDILSQNHCSSIELIKVLNYDLKGLSEDDFVDKFKCLGEIKFFKTAFGIM